MEKETESEESGIYVVGEKHHLFFKKIFISVFAMFTNACNVYIHVLLE